MQEDVQRRAILLALAALTEMADEAESEPYRPCLRLRALLAFLTACGAERRAIDEFWRTMTGPTLGVTSEVERRYIRRSYGRTHLARVWASLGTKGGVQRLITTNTAEGRNRLRFAEMVREQGALAEVKASKGHPRTADAKRVMEERLRRGEPLD